MFELQKYEKLSRQEKRSRNRQASKTLGKLNHILENPTDKTLKQKKLALRRIKQYKAELQAMGVFQQDTKVTKAKRFFSRLFARLRPSWL